MGYVSKVRFPIEFCLFALEIFPDQCPVNPPDRKIRFDLWQDPNPILDGIAEWLFPGNDIQMHLADEMTACT